MANANLIQRCVVKQHAVTPTDPHISWARTPSEHNMLLFFYAENKDGSSSMTAPSGWTEVNQHYDTSVAGGVFYKLAGASETRKVVLDVTAFDTNNWSVLVLEEWAGLSAFDQGAENFGGLNTTCSTGTTATLTDSNSWAIAFWASDTTNGSGNATFFPTAFVTDYEQFQTEIDADPDHVTATSDISGTTGVECTITQNVSDQTWGCMSVFRLRSLTYEMDRYRFFNDGAALPKFDQTTPVIEAADITTSENISDASPDVDYPAYVAGDLIIMTVGYQKSSTQTIQMPTSGPGGETIHALHGQGYFSTSVDCCGIWWIGGGTQSAGSLAWTFNSNTCDWVGHTIKVLAAEVDSNDPIGACGASEQQSASTGVDSGELIIQNKGARVVGHGACVGTTTIAANTGWTERADEVDANSSVRVGIFTRDTATSNDENIALGTQFATAGTSVINAGSLFTVMGNRTLTGRTAKAAENTSADLTVDTDYGLHVRFWNKGQDEASATTFKWQYNYNNGDWTDLTTSSTHAQVNTTTDFNDGDDVEEVFFDNGNGRFVDDNNAAVEDINGQFAPTAAILAGEAIEAHVNFQIVGSAVADGNSISFRVIDNAATATWDYDVTATATIDKPVPTYTQTDFRVYNDDGTALS